MPYKDPDKNREYARVYNKARIESNRQYVAEYKRATGCKLCPENEPVALDFHHVSGKKEMSLSRMLIGGSSRDRINKEIEKCILVCANCHRKLHAGIITLSGMV